MATVRGILEAFSIMPVSVTTGNEARPSTEAKVLWIGSSTAPVNMAEGDIWLRPASTGPAAPEILTTVLNTMTQSAAFSQTLIVNGTPPFTFSITAGSLPAGLSLNSTTGAISGTPSSSGSYSFTVQASNAQGSDTQAFSGTVTSSPVAPTITTTTLNSLTQSVAFSQTLNATGTAPLTWTISAGSLPAGLSLNSSTGAITGSPSGSGAYSFTVQATNTAGNDTQAYSGTIASSGTAPTITTTILSTMQVGASFSQTINKTGSTPMTWGVTVGSLPAGLALNSSTGVISGTPTTAAAYSFTVQATNAFGSDTQAFTGTVDPSEDATNYSIFAGAATGSLTSHNDADAGSYTSHLFYPASPGLPSGAQIFGAGLYIPAGSAHIGQSWSAAYQVRASSFWPGGGALDQSVYESNGTKKAGATLVAGWNYLEFDTKANTPAVGGSWVIGVIIGDGTRYLFDTTVAAGAIQQSGGQNFYLSETSGTGVARSFYRSSVSTGGGIRWYGIDTVVSIPA